MDCQKIDDMTSEVTEHMDKAWTEGIAAGDSLTALNHFSVAAAIIHKMMDEIRG